MNRATPVNGPGYRFFLGGQDLEMQEIRRLLTLEAPQAFEDAGLAWGARASAYADAIGAALARGEKPVLIELDDDLPPSIDRERLILVDHHGARAGHDRPTALEQVFTLLQLPAERWTRRMALVAANDRAHVAGMLAAGATRAEMLAIRAADRAAQGVTAADEAEALLAIAARQTGRDFTEIATASRTSSAIADLMLAELGGPGYRGLLVVMPGKLAAFADGPVIERLAAAMPAGYWGGDLPRRGFWGICLPAAGDAAAAILAKARAAFSAANAPEDHPAAG